MYVINIRDIKIFLVFVICVIFLCFLNFDIFKDLDFYYCKSLLFEINLIFDIIFD